MQANDNYRLWPRERRTIKKTYDMTLAISLSRAVVHLAHTTLACLLIKLKQNLSVFTFQVLLFFYQICVFNVCTKLCACVWPRMSKTKKNAFQA